jgi:putative nucleotidyltransferase with HDIG domain
VGSAIIYLHLDLPEIWRSNSKVLMVFGSLCVNLLMIRLLYLWSISQHLSTFPELPEVLFLVPMVFAPPLLSVLMGTRAGLYAVVVASMTDSLLINQSFPLLLISLTTGFIAVFFTRHVRRRSNMVRAGMAVGVTSFLCTMAYGFVAGSTHMSDLFQQGVICVAVGVITAILINSLLPIVESLFNINTDIAWVELSDLNHPLLRQMSLEAPGTYHHSLAVANLSEAAAVSIGANGTLCRVMAYFHDIGKVPKPEYFIENTGPESTPHDQLTPQMSALVIAAHVKEGVNLALKYRLKKSLLDAIQQHHGDSLIYFFYRRAQQLAEDARAGSEIMNLPQEDVPDVSEQNFRYPGPRPQTREIGLLMLADSIEGASRSLDKPTPQRIEELVNDIIRQKIQDHQLDECPLSLLEIRLAADSFTFTLKTMLHSRISYPKHATSSHTPHPAQPTKRLSHAHEETRDLSASRA